MNKYIKNNRGVILLLTLFILSGILIITLAAAELVLAGIKMNRLTGYSSLAYFASEAGLEKALFEVRKNSYLLPAADTTGVFNLPNLGNNSAYSVNYATSSPKVTFQSIGSYGGARRSVEATYLIGASSCTPNCSGKVCGSDGCGGSCGICSSGLSCVFGACVENPSIIYAIFASAGSGGSISPSGTVAVNQGDNQSFNISADFGYIISSVIVDDIDQGPIFLYPFDNVQADHTIFASFMPDTRTLTYTAGPNGSISGTSPQTVYYLQDGTAVTANPIVDYIFLNWSDGSTANPRTDTNVTDDISVTANFVSNIYNLIYTAGPNGSIIGTSPQIVNYLGSGTAVTADPSVGFIFLNWSDGSTINPRTDTSVTANISVTANFVSSTYNITASAGSGGSISPSGVVTVNYGNDQAFNIATTTGYHISSVLIDGAPVGTPASYTFYDVQDTHTIAVNFAINTYIITASAGSGGSISPSGAVLVDHGSNQLFTFPANSGYIVNQVLVDGANQGSISSYSFNNIQGPHTISVSFVTASQVAYPTSGTYSWVVPAGVTRISAVLVGGGGGGSQGGTYNGGGGGGGLRYINDLTVTPGETITVVVGAGGVSTANNVQTPGGYSRLSRGANVLVQAGGGGAAAAAAVTGGAGGTGTAIGSGPFGGTIGGYTGGAGGTGSSNYGAGGGGASGYSGNGGVGGNGVNNGNGSAGAGGGAGGGGGGTVYAGDGGGVGLLGGGSSGSGGVYNSGAAGGGSGGANGGVAGVSGNIGGAYGGAGGGVDGSFVSGDANGAGGAVRIIWPGSIRQFPSTNTVDVP